MNFHELVFSEQKRIQYRRHFLFWLSWLIYFDATFFYKQQPLAGQEWLQWISVLWVKSILILMGHLFICYVGLYFLLPLFLLKAKYASFAGLLLASGVLVTAWTYFCYHQLFPLPDSIFNLQTKIAGNTLLWNSLATGLLSSLKLVAVAIMLKLLKSWWLKQNENLQLEKEKVRTELQLLKAQIHPDFLFSSLDKIYSYAHSDFSKASSLLLKLSDLLSYILYECNCPLVPLEKEIEMLRNYLELEKKRLGEQLDAEIQVIGDANNNSIAPLMLLPFVENSFLFCEFRELEKFWINIDLRIHQHQFSMKLINGKQPKNVITEWDLKTRLSSVQKRLQILYENAYELKITDEGDFMITHLKIELDKRTNELLVEEMAIAVNEKILNSHVSI